ncbi:hypothetical protein IF2G_02550 [Cordyceps javanica]|nr:hypothetical protein IF2G_02550 [Cordyceps javanica]
MSRIVRVWPETWNVIELACKEPRAQQRTSIKEWNQRAEPERSVSVFPAATFPFGRE